MNVLKELNIPKDCEVNQFVAKKHFYENAGLSKLDIDLFADVKKITVLYQLSSDKINIPQYIDNVRNYPFINFLEVQLLKDIKTKRLSEIIMRSIPSPMVLIFMLEDKVQLYVAHQRTNQNDSSKNTIEEFISTDWLETDNPLFEKLDIRQMRFTNFYDLYSDIVDAISIYNANTMMQSEKELTGEQARQLTASTDTIEQEITLLKAKLKKETQFNRKMELNIQIKKLEKMLKDILEV